MPRYRAAALILPGHPLHGHPVDLLVEDDKLTGVAPADGALDATRGDRDLGSTRAFAGWWDLQTDFRDPGTERAEGLNHGLTVAAQGGFAKVAPVASTRPCRDQPAEIQAILHRSHQHVTGVLPVAALSAGRAGKELTEAHALVEAGALAFSDDAPVDRPELLRRALEYHGGLGTPVFSEAHDPEFQPEGLMHEGAASTRMGLPGLSEESETLRIRRDLDILRYSGGRLHIPVVTTAAGVQSIRDAKAEGLSVTCGTTAHHLCWTDEPGGIQPRSPSCPFPCAQRTTGPPSGRPPSTEHWIRSSPTTAPGPRKSTMRTSWWWLPASPACMPWDRPSAVPSAITAPRPRTSMRPWPDCLLPGRGGS